MRVLLTGIFLFASCSTLTKVETAKRTDYMPSMYYLSQGDPTAARMSMPKAEPGGLITTVEKGWLDLLAGKADPVSLRKMSDDLESKKTFKIVSESKSFFYKESQDTYFPAEHEVIATHLITGFSYVQKGDLGAARVEAKKAGFYLQNDFKQDEEFDAPGLRIWLAALWAVCGEWDSARVDLRVVGKMGENYEWARKISGLARPPKTIALVLSGAGPDLMWDRQAARFEGGLRFVSISSKSSFNLGNIKIQDGADSSQWYTRHIYRNFLIKDLMSDSRYMAESIIPVGAAGSLVVAGTGLGVAVGAASVIGGIGVAWYGLQALGTGSTAGELAMLPIIGGVGIGSFGIKKGKEIIAGSKKASNDIIDSTISPADAYRYIRFLPNWIYLAVSDVDVQEVDLIQKDDGRRYKPIVDVNSRGGQSRVLAYFVPGSTHERLEASKYGRWIHPDRCEEWVVMYDMTPGKMALSTCQSLGRDDGFSSWSLPNWPQYKAASEAGAFASRNLNLTASHLVNEEFWATSPGGAQPNQCRTIDIRDGSDGPVSDCETPRRLLCVRTRQSC